MGSGMLPYGAYITLEHEWILIFRKGKRVYKSAKIKHFAKVVLSLGRKECLVL
jgi:uncharacterized protein (DUF2345 family)